MLGMMNSGMSDTVEFYASPSSTRQIAVGDKLEVFSQAKSRPRISYTTDGKRLVDGKLDNSQVQPQKSWNQLIINQQINQHIKFEEPEIQRKSSTKKVVTSLRRFLPSFNSSKKQLKMGKSEIPTQKIKSVCPTKKTNAITVVE